MNNEYGVKGWLSVVVLMVSFSMFAGNLVYNSSFEKTTNPGIPDGFKCRWRHAMAMSAKPADWRTDSQNPFHGKRSLKTESGFPTQLLKIHLQKGDSVFSVYARASEPNSKVAIVSVYGKFKGGNYRIGKEWRRLSLVIHSAKSRNVSILLLNNSKGTVWWDAAQMEKGEKVTKYKDDYHSLLSDVRAHGKPKETPRYKIEKTNTPPVIDGVLDDVCWHNRKQVLIPSVKDHGVADTRIMMTYDDSMFYLGITCMEPYMRHLVAKHKKHDDLVYADDSLELFFDTEDKQSSYDHFMLNCIGAKAEERVWRYNRQWLWNGPWKAKVKQRSASRWSIVRGEIHVDPSTP